MKKFEIEKKIENFEKNWLRDEFVFRTWNMSAD